MESQAFKLFLAFIGVMAVGFGIVATTRETSQDKKAGVLLQTSSLLSGLALDKCSEAVQKEVGQHPYKPSETDSDHMSYVMMTWKNLGSSKQVECRYVIDQGITLLKVDEKTVIAKENTQTVAPPSNSRPEHH